MDPADSAPAGEPGGHHTALTVPAEVGNPVEVANLVSWLATDAASYIIGQVIGADGGFLAS